MAAKNPDQTVTKRTFLGERLVFKGLKCYYDENRILQITAILRHKHVVRISIKMLFTVFNYPQTRFRFIVSLSYAK